MAVYLIVGLPGTGKSMLNIELGKLGYEAIDADWDRELSVHRHSETGLMKRDLSPYEAASGKFRWAWNEDRLKQLIGNYSSGTHFIIGHSVNIREFYGLFDKVFTLAADDETLKQRIAARKEGYGQTPDEMAKILAANKTVAKREHEHGAVIIDANQPTTAVAKAILKACDDN
jgi:dephospho-CoA kinase